MAATLDLYIELYAKKLVKGPSNGSAFTLPTFHQGDVVPFVITILKPPPSGTTYNKIEVGDISLKFAVGDQPVGTASTPTPFVTQYSWSQNTTDRNLYASVAFNTSELNTWIGAASSKDAYLEIEMVEGSNVMTIYQGKISIAAELIEDSTPSVAPGQTAISLETANALFLKKYADAGDTLTLRTADGTASRTIGIYKDGSAIIEQNDIGPIS